MQVAVAAQDGNDTNPDQLHYRWAATEGTINNIDAPSTTWTIPSGSGLQFAYVLVSDSKGGYAESRAAALTFTGVGQAGTANVVPSRSSSINGFAWGTLFVSGKSGPPTTRNVYLPGVTLQISGQQNPITTDFKGEFFVPNLSPGSYTANYTLPGGVTGSFTISVALNSLPTSPSAPSPSGKEGYIRVPVAGGALRIRGHVSLADGSLCGIRNEFFTSASNPNLLTGPISATVQLLDANSNPLGSIVPVNHYGDFFITGSALGGSTNALLRVRCEQAPDKIVNVTVPASGDFSAPSITIDSLSNPPTPNKRPKIQHMTVTLGGRDVGRPDLPKPTTLLPEMDLAPGDDAFLTYKGIDTRKGACAYYYQIGAVGGCDSDGFPTGTQLTLDQWRKNYNLSPFHDGNPLEPEFKAIYINKQDLNLTRDMQAIKLARDGGTLAYNVCNSPGPQDVTDPLGSPKLIGKETQPDIDLAIDNAKRGIGKVVCVAMDYTPTQGIRFYTFSPSGRLLLSVSLDGRREKFMPGACVACHGGDNYGGKFPDNYSLDPQSKAIVPATVTGPANLGSYFLPFDVANFYFSSSDPSLLRTVVLTPLRQMNQLLTSIPSSASIKPIADELKTFITTSWYPCTQSAQGCLAGTSDDGQAQPTPSVYSNQLIPGTGTQACTSCHTSGSPGTGVPGPYNAATIHTAVIAPSCQICHTSNAFVVDPQAGGSPRITFLERPPMHYLWGSNTLPRGPHPICGGSPDLKMNHVMPNALGSFERFWLQGSTQPATLFSIPSPGSGQEIGSCTSLNANPGLQ